ncbi:copper homeostasis protein CutC [Alginatibacterium sediminis]|uniref:PF03932 family protein CutC n=1 Tax=Alginatibacterium sediminis TaxID=2164068 RepID=A0A420EBQ2_9ALTE|nr:copper homeostasis protein CutC [Alginatibacterium sediminis]RKF18073.1 copper homeostasis protein CutC [Alginatibacterium sediminis]
MGKSKVKIEVCIDNIESLHTAIEAGADRIELCSALALGGLSPSCALLSYAIANSPIPIYAMVRPRSGDFVYSAAEVDMMCFEIEQFKSLGVHGVVLGLLDSEGLLPQADLKRLVEAANGVGLTFHRAFDLCSDWQNALETLIDFGFERILSSGQRASAIEGIATLEAMATQADDRIKIMPGAGLNASNAQQIVEQTGAGEVHLSGKGKRESLFTGTSNAVMGQDADLDRWIDVTDFKKVAAVRRLF